MKEDMKQSLPTTAESGNIKKSSESKDNEGVSNNSGQKKEDLSYER